MAIKSHINLNKTLIVFLIIAIAGFSIRIYNLNGNPLDFDESIHAYTSFWLFKEGFYVYDTDSHGPFLYYITAGIFHVLGDNDFSARLLSAIFGGIMILLILPLRRYLGDVKFFIISSMFAFSYFFVTYSRQIRQEIFLAFFILAFIVCIMLFLKLHSKSYLYLGFTSLMITMTIKPTTYIFMFIIVIFLLFNRDVFFYVCELSNKQIGRKVREKENKTKKRWFFDKLNYFKKNEIYSTIFFFVLIFIAINYIFYNNILAGFIDPVSHWLKIVIENDKYERTLFPPFYFYALNMIKFDFVIFITGLIGCIYYLGINNKNYFINFCSLWAVLSLLIYSLIPYKTSELTLNIILPFIIVSGFFLGDLIERFFYKKKVGIILIISIILISSIYITYPFNINNKNQYEDIDKFIKINGQKDIIFDSIVFSRFSNPWPLPWYLREYNLYQVQEGRFVTQLKVIFGADYFENTLTKPIIISSRNITYPIEILGYNIKHFENHDLFIYY